MNKDIHLTMVVSDILLDIANQYHDNYDEWTTSDFQGYCMAQANDIIRIVKEDI